MLSGGSCGRLYLRRAISSGKAAQWLEMTLWEFVRHASRLGILFFDMTEDEWKSELEMARAPLGRSTTTSKDQEPGHS